MLNVFMSVSEWVYRLLVANFYWVLGVLVGGVLFGFMPATIALHEVTRKWAYGQFDFSISKTFFQSYKSKFFKKNMVGAVFLLLGGLLFVNLRFATLIEGTVMMVVFYFILFILLLLLISMIVFFSVYTHYHYESWRQYVVQSFAIAIGSPGLMVRVSIGFLLLAWLFYQLPGLMMFFLAVLPAYWSSIACKKRFAIIENLVTSST
ncbi:YesL family protein [Halalkalibacter sp. APA_J-10(15)]|uniref:YesL family protein n=1 Tax=Halalkalibacter sp. APA_J-10(15) TaxID=2933805 RepID=UPI001FF115F7|nr:DUF624 domain-containing protein [Halalkalibacter sp. APA_J-10(15)]MCK0470149.1 DUF624 domain-containing protein [Halalkalibacter sp. APA_J-10(15)]